MRRVLMLGAVVCLAVSTVVVLVHLTQRRVSILPKVYAQEEEDQGSINIGAGQVTLTQDQLRSTDGTLAAFVPTGSLNHKCLVTLAESTFPVPGLTMFCAARAPSGLGQGVIIHIFFPFPPPPQFLYVVTVYQEGARSYGTPVLCNVAGCWSVLHLLAGRTFECRVNGLSGRLQTVNPKRPNVEPIHQPALFQMEKLEEAAEPMDKVEVERPSWGLIIDQQNPIPSIRKR